MPTKFDQQIFHLPVPFGRVSVLNHSTFLLLSMGNDVPGRIDMPHKVGFCFGILAVVLVRNLVGRVEKGCDTRGGIVDDASSLIPVEEVIWFAVLLKLALLPARDRFLPRFYSQVES